MHSTVICDVCKHNTRCHVQVCNLTPGSSALQGNRDTCRKGNNKKICSDARLIKPHNMAFEPYGS